MKPYKITKFNSEQDFDLLDNMFNIIFSEINKHKSYKVLVLNQNNWNNIDNLVKEKELVIIQTLLGVRLYTKINNQLRYINFS